ncbi:hypothetical protein [Rothia nasimurium]|uniref:hypothetical protein n=1 Tax=Rothia nasimurium TaxID=85336 RepID=UPI003B9F62D9
MKKYFSFDERRTASGGFSRGFLALFAFLLVPAASLWVFYRWLFAGDTSWFALAFLTPVTAWVWAYLIGYGADNHLGEE